MNPRSSLASLALSLATLAIGCGAEGPPADDIESTQQALSTSFDEMPQNGYSPKGLAPNYPLLWTVWQHPLNDMGVGDTLRTTVSAYGISTSISSLFNTGNLTTSAEYLMDEIVECALNSGSDVSYPLGTTTRTSKGKFGLCDTGSPVEFDGWRTTPASLACRYMVSACILARMNALGRHVPISIRVPDEVGAHPVDASKFAPVDRVRVQTTDRNGNAVGVGWQPDFVGICTRGTTVALERTTAATGRSVLVCSGIQACKPDPTYQEPIVFGSLRIYSGFLGTFGSGTPISFTCPANASAAPDGKPGQAYFSILVSPGTEGALPHDSMFMRISNPTTTYPAPESDVFTYVEGGFYGNLLPNPGVGVDTNACYSPLWQAGIMYEAGRMCAAPGDPAGCFIRSSPCQRDCMGRSPNPDEAYYDCLSDVDVPRWTGVTVFLNEPSAFVASAIEAVHDVCTPGAPMVNDKTNGVVTSVCTADPYCCSAAWDSRCVNEVQTVAGSQACGTIHCSHSVCTTDAALVSGCNPVVKSICAVDSFCCNTAWDSTCVQEVQTVANSQQCACSHPVCTTGTELNNGCSPVATSVCAVDPYCCNAAWDSTCVQEVQTVANSQQCGCSHPACTTGAALVGGCSPVVTSICAADAYCCSTAWDGICVQEVQTVANSKECLSP